MTEKIRQSNFELLRIISMAMIVLGHVSGQSGINESTIVANRIFAAVLGSGSRIAVDIFLMIGCWFMVSSSFKAERFIKLWLQTLIIVVPLVIIGYVFAPEYRDIKTLIFSFLPITGGYVWYASVYMILYLLSPFLALYCKKVSENSLKCTVFLGGVFVA